MARSGNGEAWPARRSSEEGIRSVRGTGRLAGSPRSPQITRRAINGRTFVSRSLDGRTYWTIFRN